MTSERQAAARRAAQAATVLAIVAVTMLAAALLRSRDRNAARDTGRQQAEHAFAVLEQATSVPLRELTQVARTLSVFSGPVAPHWRDLTAAAMQEPSVFSIVRIDRVPRAERAAYERRLGARISEQGPAGPRPAGSRSDHFVVDEVLTRARSLRGLGMDVGAARSGVLRATAQAGVPRATPPVPFQGDPRHRSGLLVYAPVYRTGMPLRTPAQRWAAVRGFVSGAYETSQLIRAVNARLERGVTIDLLDHGVVVGGRAGGTVSGIRKTVRVAGQPLTVVAHPAAHAGGPWPWTVTTIGLSLAALVALVLRLDRRREGYALALVAERMAERDAVEEDLRRERDRTATLMRSIADGVVSLDAAGVITEVNDHFCRMVDFQPDELVGTSAPFPFWPPEDFEALLKPRNRVRAGHDETAEAQFMRKGGERFPVLFTAALAHEPDGTPIGFVCTVKDISERKRYEDRLATLAAHDALTGLLNHRSFQEHLHAEVARVERHNRPLSLVILDLDRFKRVNDRLGHPVGDRVLADVAQRLRRIVRRGEWLARIGGEEFAWILPDTDGVGAYAAAERARRAIAGEPFDEAGVVTTSAGVCDLTEGHSAEELYRLADVALYWAKSHGRNMTFRYSAAVAGELGEVETPAEVERRQTVRTLHSLAAVVEAKDVASTGHTDRVAELVHRLATVAGWPAERAARLREAALLHDVGKVALRAEILSKPARLTPEEYEHVKTHAAIGARMVASVLDAEQTAWVRQHHERWDGGGYPDGLRAEEISDGGALLAMADAFDAMTSPRAYKAAMDLSDAVAEARDATGTQFAPTAVALLERLLNAEPGPAAPAPGPATTER